MELTLNTSDYDGRSHVPYHGIKEFLLFNPLHIVKISIHKKITLPCFIRNIGKAGELITYTNKPGQRGVTSRPINN